MRIGTWNLAGRWTPGHQQFIENADCDVWLLTEVNERVELDGFHRHLATGLMAQRRRWAGVYSRSELQPLSDPHVASAAAVVDGTTYCSTILPWRSCGGLPTWPGVNHADKTEIAVSELLQRLPSEGLVWGGDWNHALSGREGAGTLGGRRPISEAVEKLGLRVPTAPLPHRLPEHLSIDHIAVPQAWTVTEATRLKADGLSDHDCYVVDFESGRNGGSEG